MKKCIPAILIPCLLLQVFGCYSMREMTIDELKTYKGSEEIRIKTNQEQISFDGQSSSNHFSDWEARDSSIIIQSKAVLSDNFNNSVKEEIIIQYNDIEKIQIKEIDSENTLFLILGILVGASVIPIVIALQNMTFGG